MSTDYDSWKDGGDGEGEGVSVEMVMGHMGANGVNAKRAVEAILGVLSKEMGEGGEGEGGQGAGLAGRWKGKSRGGIMGLEGKGGEAVERLRWLFGDEWVRGEV